MTVHITGGNAPIQAGAAAPARIRSLDGFRTLAILSVVAYHLGLPWFPSGHMGVVMFLVLTGYLVTGSVFRRVARDGAAALPVFWWRRFKRIWPAMALMVAGVASLCIVFDHVLLTKLRPDALPALGFFANWHYILEGASYFDQIGAPSPLTHLWYVAVDAQLCVALPLVVLVCVRLLHLGRAGTRRVLLVLAAASAALMWLLFDPAADPSRVYYGTDTRAFSVLAGGWLALAWPLGEPPAWALSTKPAKDGTPRLKVGLQLALETLGLASLAALVAAMVLVPAESPLFYQGGMAAVTALSVLLVAALAAPHGLLGRLFALPPLAWFGERSYGVYLWHYPLIIMLGAYTATASWQVMAIAFALSVVAAVLSWRFLEEPIANGRAAAAWRFLRGESEDAEAAAAPQAPAVFENPADAEMLAILEELETPDYSEAPGHPGAPDDPEVPDDPEALEYPADREMPAAAETAESAELAETPDVPAAPEAAETVGAPDAPRVPAAPSHAKAAGRPFTVPRVVAPVLLFTALALFAIAGCILVPEKTLVPEDAIKSTGTSAEHGMDLSSIERPTDDARAAVPLAATDDSGMLVLTEPGVEAPPPPVEEPQIPDGPMVVYASPDVVSSGRYDPVLVGDSVPGDTPFYSVFPDGLLDSYIGRRPDAAISVLRDYIAQGIVGSTVIVAAFSNTTAWPDQLDELVAVAGPDKQVFLVATVNPDGFQDEANYYLMECANKYENVHYVDWPATAAGNEWLYIYPDGTHVTPDGAWVYLEMIARSVAPVVVGSGGSAVPM